MDKIDDKPNLKKIRHRSVIIHFVNLYAKGYRPEFIYNDIFMNKGYEISYLRRIVNEKKAKEVIDLSKENGLTIDEAIDLLFD